MIQIHSQCIFFSQGQGTYLPVEVDARPDDRWTWQKSFHNIWWGSPRGIFTTYDLFTFNFLIYVCLNWLQSLGVKSDLKLIVSLCHWPRHTPWSYPGLGHTSTCNNQTRDMCQLNWQPDTDLQQVRSCVAQWHILHILDTSTWQWVLLLMIKGVIHIPQ